MDEITVSDASTIPSTVGTGSVKKESILATCGTTTRGQYDSDDEIFALTFCTVGSVIVPHDNELNIEGLEKMFGQNEQPIPKSWIILDSQSTVNCFSNHQYLTNI